MWGGGEPAKEDPNTRTGEEEEDGDVEDMNFAEKLSAVVGVLFVEKYEYTVDGLYYGANMVYGNTIGVCNSGAEANPNPENAPIPG